MKRNPIKEPIKGDMWDGGFGINVTTLTVTLVGSEYIELKNPIYPYGKHGSRVIKLKTFRHNCKWHWSYGGNEVESDIEL